MTNYRRATFDGMGSTTGKGDLKGRVVFNGQGETLAETKKELDAELAKKYGDPPKTEEKTQTANKTKKDLKAEIEAKFESFGVEISDEVQKKINGLNKADLEEFLNDEANFANPDQEDPNSNE